MSRPQYVAPEPIWDKIQKLLDERDMNANQLAVAIHAAGNGVIYQIKRNPNYRPSFELMERIADALDVSMDEFRTRGKGSDSE